MVSNRRRTSHTVRTASEQGTATAQEVTFEPDRACQKRTSTCKSRQQTHAQPNRNKRSFDRQACGLRNGAQCTPLGTAQTARVWKGRNRCVGRGCMGGFRAFDGARLCRRHCARAAWALRVRTEGSPLPLRAPAMLGNGRWEGGLATTVSLRR